MSTAGSSRVSTYSFLALFLAQLLCIAHAQEEASMHQSTGPLLSYRDALWIAKTDSLQKVSEVDGGVIFEISDGLEFRAIAIDEWNGIVWAYGSSTLRGFHFDGSALLPDPVFVALLEDGNEEDSESEDDRHVALGVSAQGESIWLGVGRHLYQFDATGKLVAVFQVEGRLRALTPPSESTLWVANKDSVTRLDDQGTVVQVIRLGNRVSIQDIDFDTPSGELWVALSDEIRVYSEDGEMICQAPFTNTVAISVDGSGGAWVAGTKTFSRADSFCQMPVEVKHGLGGTASAATSKRTDELVWIASQKELARFDAEGGTDLSLRVGESIIRDIALYTDSIPPEVQIEQPASGSLLNGNVPEIRISYADQGIGADPGTLTFQLNSEAIDVACTLGVSAGVCTPSQGFPEGPNILEATIRDYAGNQSQPSSTSFTIDTVPPHLSFTQPEANEVLQAAIVSVLLEYGDTTSGVDTDTLQLLLNGQAVAVSGCTVNEHSASCTLESIIDGSHSLNAVLSDLAGNQAEVSLPFQVLTTNQVPVLNAPALEASPGTTLFEAGQFLYTQENPVQTGMEPETIDPPRAAVIRGAVTNRSGDSLSGVKVTVLGHPEFGHTYTRTDGWFDLFVNGGGRLLLVYQKEGYLEVQRNIQVPWQDWVVVPDVVMTDLDQNVTTIEVNSSIPVQVARGGVQQDSDGQRQATLMIFSGTSASLVLPDGTEQPVEGSLDIRATEYTVGPAGFAAMPAELPAASGYTYCVELSADEAIQAGAAEVRFSQPASLYVENFIGFPVGGIVPVGYYSRSKGQWIPSRNGLIVGILAIENGEARLDTDGDNLAEELSDLLALGFNASELATLAELYVPGTALWRIPVHHMTPYDPNWPVKDEGEDPDEPEPEKEDKEDDDCKEFRSIIECRSQVLGESIPISGTPFALNYRSDRVRGRKAAYRTSISLTRAQVPEGLKRIELDITIAGRRFRSTFSPSPNQRTVFEWDGKDAYGRELQGEQPARIRLGYVFDLYYSIPEDQVEFAFGMFGRGTSFSCEAGSCLFPARQERTRWQEWQTSLGVFQATSIGLGGWTLSPQHSLDTASGNLYMGTGERRQSDSRFVIDTVNWTKAYWIFASPSDLDIDSEGRVYILGDNKVSILPRTYHNPGTVQVTYAGGGSPADGLGDGGAATEAKLRYPSSMAFGLDGSLYIADAGHYRVRKVSPDGIIETIAGTGTYGTTADGVPATSTNIYPNTLAVGPDGSLFVGDIIQRRIFRIDGEGVIHWFAGNGENPVWSSECPRGDGGPALDAIVGGGGALAAGPDGSLYVAEGEYVRRITPDGIIRAFAGKPCQRGYAGDGGPAIEALLEFPRRLEISPAGELLILELSLSGYYNGRLRVVSSAGTISTMAGIPDPPWEEMVACSSGKCPGDGGPPAAALLLSPSALAFHPDGSIYIGQQPHRSIDKYGRAVRVMRSVHPLRTSRLSTIDIASQDGQRLFKFSQAGHHLLTAETVTGTSLHQFEYDDAGRIISVEDYAGNRTVIERDIAGRPVAIVGPYGHRSNLALDSSGYLSGVTNPVGGKYTLSHSSDGLLETLTNPLGNSSTYTYSDDGRLVRDQDSLGGFTALARSTLSNGVQVTKTTNSGRTTTYATERLQSGEVRSTSSQGCCGETETVVAGDGTATTRYADGTVVTTISKPDPRWGLQAPLATETVATPGGLSRLIERSRSASLTDSNPLDVLSLSEEVSVNGKVYSKSFESSTRRVDLVTPEGRTLSLQLDSLGRVSQRNIPGIHPAEYIYDNRGRLNQMNWGDREYRVTYDANGSMQEFLDPELNSRSFEYDASGRLLRAIDPSGESTLFDYDASGQLTSIAPPGRSPHLLGYSTVGLPIRYLPPEPEPGSATEALQAFFNLDRDLTSVEKADGRRLEITYDDSGNRIEVTTPQGTVRYGYNSSSNKLERIDTPEGQKLQFSYDGFLLTDVEWTGPVSGTVSYTYNNEFAVASQRVNQQLHADYLYDSDGLLIRAGDLSLIREASNGFLRETSIGNVQSQISRNDYGEELSREVLVSGTGLYSTTYSRDQLGRIQSRSETLFGTTRLFDYAYDSKGQLLEITRDGQPWARYEWDANGNRILRSAPGSDLAGYFDGQDRMVSYGNQQFSYSENGEVVRMETVTGSSVTVYEYDALGNLVKIVLPDQSEVSYVVDGRNRRVGKRVDGALVETYLYGENNQLLALTDSNGTLTSRFVYGTRPQIPDYMVRNGRVYRIIADHVGSPRLVIDVETGVIEQRMEFDEFGILLEDTNPGFQPFGFAGGLLDPATGWVRLGVRDYFPWIGRFTTKDPLGLSANNTNLYTYPHNDPINYVDISGRWGELLNAINLALENQAYADAGSPFFDVITSSELADWFSDDLTKAGSKNLTCALRAQSMMDALGGDTVTTTEEIFRKYFKDCDQIPLKCSEEFWNCVERESSKHDKETQKKERQQCPELFPGP